MGWVSALYMPPLLALTLTLRTNKYSFGLLDGTSVPSGFFVQGCSYNTHMRSPWLDQRLAPYTSRNNVLMKIPGCLRLFLFLISGEYIFRWQIISMMSYLTRLNKGVHTSLCTHFPTCSVAISFTPVSLSLQNRSYKQSTFSLALRLMIEPQR